MKSTGLDGTKPSATGAYQASEEISKRKYKRFISNILLPHLSKLCASMSETTKKRKIKNHLLLRYTQIGVYCTEHFTHVYRINRTTGYIAKCGAYN